MVMLKQQWICVLLIITKINKYEIWIYGTTFHDFKILADIKNVQYINKSVCELQVLLVILRTPMENTYHETHKEN